jgi:hypothetical protein
MSTVIAPEKQGMMQRVEAAPIVGHVSGFGAVVHTLPGKVNKEYCGCNTYQNVMTLFEGGIQSQSIDTAGCGMYSHTFVNVIPKHSIIGGDRRETRGHGSRTD